MVCETLVFRKLLMLTPIKKAIQIIVDKLDIQLGIHVLFKIAFVKTRGATGH